MSHKVRIFLRILILLIVTVIAGTLIYNQRKSNNITQYINNTNDILIYKRSEGWGPCPSEKLTCSLDTYLYKSGKLIFIGDTNVEVKLNKEIVAKIVSKIEESGVLDKDCSGPIVLDYAVEYEININGKTKKIGYEDTKCWDDLTEVNQIIDSYHDNSKRQGGA